jgi:hypothetical protein
MCFRSVSRAPGRTVLRATLTESAGSVGAGQLAGHARRPDKSGSARSELRGASSDACARPSIEAEGSSPSLLHRDTAGYLSSDFQDVPEHLVGVGGVSKREAHKHQRYGTKLGNTHPHWNWQNPLSGTDWRILRRKIGRFSNSTTYLLFQKLRLHFQTRTWAQTCNTV